MYTSAARSPACRGRAATACQGGAAARTAERSHGAACLAPRLLHGDPMVQPSVGNPLPGRPACSPALHNCTTALCSIHLARTPAPAPAPPPFRTHLLPHRRRRALLPGVVDPKGIAGIQEGAIELGQPVLPLQLALGGDGVIPEGQRRGGGACRKELGRGWGSGGGVGLDDSGGELGGKRGRDRAGRARAGERDGGGGGGGPEVGCSVWHRSWTCVAVDSSSAPRTVRPPAAAGAQSWLVRSRQHGWLGGVPRQLTTPPGSSLAPPRACAGSAPCGLTRRAPPGCRLRRCCPAGLKWVPNCLMHAWRVGPAAPLNVRLARQALNVAISRAPLWRAANRQSHASALQSTACLQRSRPAARCWRPRRHALTAKNAAGWGCGLAAPRSRC